MAYCRPEHLHENAENIGAYLEGDREENSLYDLHVGEAQFCRVLCNAVRDWLKERKRRHIVVVVVMAIT